MGRNSKLTPEITEKICDALRAGNTQKAACQYVGISERTFFNWINRGEADEEPYLQFVQDIKSAEGAAIVGFVSVIAKAASNGQWQAAAWYLERKYPDEWGKVDRKEIKHSGKVDMTDDERVARAKELLSLAKERSTGEE